MSGRRQDLKGVGMESSSWTPMYVGGLGMECTLYTDLYFVIMTMVSWSKAIGLPNPVSL
jgi:hypothetical protein